MKFGNKNKCWWTAGGRGLGKNQILGNLIHSGSATFETHEKRESEAIGQEKENMDKTKNGGLCYRWKFLGISRSNMNISSTLPRVQTKGK